MATARLQTAVVPPPTAAPIRSRTTPTMSWWSAPAARVFARWSAAAKPGCAPPASPRYFRLARIPSPPRAASRLPSATCITTTGAGICTTPSRDRTGSATRTPSNIWCATRPRRSTSSSIGACRFRAPKKARSTNGPFGGMTLDFGKGQAQRTCAAADRTGHAMLHTHVWPGAAAFGRILHRILSPSI